ncbi:hypothetical protein DAPPUDRAFT_238746 [Daphnia pulex]|uniref:Uncharacterized protein n=1 Tax=Daphnia pulex TaxID=6669 RepID=E9G7A1_DAPPU|nr:hypothetical protein DAPPUDRAFT_238746 [Daphnia pulex]|eukprot:EFX84434.1 hypothetical protein DAPPUDRAFT_238746 [Daphnia pulex]
MSDSEKAKNKKYVDTSYLSHVTTPGHYQLAPPHRLKSGPTGKGPVELCKF